VKTKNPRWPSELKRPIIVDEILKSIPPQQRFKHLDTELTIAIVAEQSRQVEIISEFLRTPLPNPFDYDWLELIVALCRHWNIPAFRLEQIRPRGPGATKIWTDRKLCELFADVQRLAQGARSELGACKFIAQNPQKFGQRYLRREGATPEAWAKTLHRQFIAAKSKIKRDHIFRNVNFSLVFGRHRPALKYGPKFVNQAIRQYGYT
jgi:hypothetical protein